MAKDHELPTEELDKVLRAAPPPQAFVDQGTNEFDAKTLHVLGVLYTAYRAGHVNLVQQPQLIAAVKLDRDELRVALDELKRYDYATAGNFSAMIKPLGVLRFEERLTMQSRIAANKKRHEILAAFKDVKHEHDEKDLKDLINGDVGLFVVALAGLEAAGVVEVSKAMGRWPQTRAHLTRDGFRLRSTRGEPESSFPTIEVPQKREAPMPKEPKKPKKRRYPDFTFNPEDEIGEWRLIRPLQKGGQGEVWEARALEEKHQIPRAIKLAFQDDEKPRQRFRREVALLTELKGEPHIVGIHDSEVEWQERVDDAPKCAFLVMDKAQGSLNDLRLSADSPTRAVHYFKDASRGIAAMHKRGIVHRDISPGNLLVLEEASRVVVADLGLAKKNGEGDEQGDGLTGIREAGGTENYRAPEVSQGGLAQATVRSDVYALGRVLEFLLTREAPNLLEPRATPRGQLLSDAACAALDAVIRRATQHRPEDRYQTVDELLAAVPRLIVDVDVEGAARPPATALAPQTPPPAALPKILVEVTSLVMMSVPRIAGEKAAGEKQRVLVISVENHDDKPIYLHSIAFALHMKDGSGSLFARDIYGLPTEAKVLNPGQQHSLQVAAETIADVNPAEVENISVRDQINRRWFTDSEATRKAIEETLQPL